ncbi:hypothetical protein MCP_2891 [Methanocella paludicola SANAE]|uniref:Uncharacterized protein n=1 Tax=Methanocella paludicola (strain DSM 17711 / JCM 13418 / NBRC 101707 / SANAE) TaxID=304371 RepID=D1Z2P1_METPS|nr:hypothetical protein [Methanocella paludicola]BAI62963.1 hypothetical protein MCP_2891 [Methanocella paludicola SANAE]
MSIVEVNGVKLNIEDAGAGLAVIPVHSIPQDHRAWKGHSGRLPDILRPHILPLFD